MELHLYAKSTGIYILEGFGLNAVDFNKVVNIWSGGGVIVKSQGNVIFDDF